MRKIVFISLLGMLGCNAATHTQPLNIAGYDWSGHSKAYLHHDLDEVSAIRYNVDGTFYTVNDEEGILYILDTASYKVSNKVKFGKSGDYEGLEIVGDNIYVLESNGDITSVAGGSKAISEKYRFEVAKKVEFESMLYNKLDQWLLMISKSSSLDKKEKATHVYAFDLRTNSYINEPVRKVSWNMINSKLPQDAKITALHPSAIARQENTGDIFMLASIEKLLIVFDKDWQVKYVEPLDSKLFKQPEGITFDSKGNIFITNEAREGRPNIIRIPIKH